MGGERQEYCSWIPDVTGKIAKVLGKVSLLNWEQRVLGGLNDVHGGANVGSLMAQE